MGDTTHKWTLSSRWVDLDLPRPRYRSTLVHRLSERLELGIEYNPGAGEFGPLANYTLAFETERTPLVNLGTSSDRIGTPRGPRSYYVTFAKTLQAERIVPYVSLNYSEHEDGFNVPFGANIFLGNAWVLIPMHDGRKSHLMLTYRERNWSASLLWVWLRHPGVAFSVGF